MNRSSVLSASALSLAATALFAGCSAADPRSCSVLCGAASECPDGLSCGIDGYCYQADQTPGSCTADLADASIVVDGAIRPVDARDPDLDADLPDEDADPCSGVVSVASINDTVFAIPDDDIAGVTSAITIDDLCGVQIETVQIRVDITHTFRGDLDAFVISPSNEVVDVFGSSNDANDDIHATFDLLFTAGEPAAGEWIFNVADLNAEDIGTLDRWSVGINEPAP